MSGVGTGVRKEMHSTPTLSFCRSPFFFRLFLLLQNAAPTLTPPAQYDLSSQTYSTDGRIYQVEYAGKAVESSGTTIGVRVTDGVVLGVEKLIVSKLIVQGSSRRLFNIGMSHGMSVAGLTADCRQLVTRARAEAQSWKSIYGSVIPTAILADRLASFMHQHTLNGGVRPFGASVLLGGYDAQAGFQLFSLDPGGNCYGYSGAALGKAASSARNELEKLPLATMTALEAVQAVAKAIYRVHDPVKDKEMELELSWITRDTNYQHQRVPQAIWDQAVRTAQAAQDENFDDI